MTLRYSVNLDFVVWFILWLVFYTLWNILGIEIFNWLMGEDV